MAVAVLDVAQHAAIGAKLKKVSTTWRAGPCPVCGGTDRFTVSISKNRWHCRGCQAGGDPIALAQHVRRSTYEEALQFLADEFNDGEARNKLDNFAAKFGGKTEKKAAGQKARQIVKETRQQPPEPEPQEDNRESAIGLWRRRKPSAGTLTDVYLRKTRMRGHYAGPIPATIGFLPASGKYPAAMIAAYGVATEPEPGMLAIADSDVRAVHLTALSATGERIRKITFGRGFQGAPIVIAPPNELLGLAITEGIEDALSVHAATGLGAWAAGSASYMPALAATVPHYVEHVTICADDNEAGQTNSLALAQRLEVRGIATTMKTLRPGQ